MIGNKISKEKEKNIIEFLNAYQMICDHHNIIISGCGCCGSPTVVELDDTDRINELKENMNHLRDKEYWYLKA